MINETFCFAPFSFAFNIGFQESSGSLGNGLLFLSHVTHIEGGTRVKETEKNYASSIWKFSRIKKKIIKKKKYIRYTSYRQDQTFLMIFCNSVIVIRFV